MKPIITNNKVIGMASVAGIISRNGRISSLGNMKIFSGKPITFTGDGMYYPLTVTSQEDGRYTSGSVQAYPGFASATARSGYLPNQKEPLFNDHFIKPDMFTTRNVGPWFSKDLFTNFGPQKPNTFKNTWFYPTFNPFMNYWR